MAATQAQPELTGSVQWVREAAEIDATAGTALPLQTPIPGLWLFRGLIEDDMQTNLEAEVLHELDGASQAQRFGQLPAAVSAAGVVVWTALEQLHAKLLHMAKAAPALHGRKGPPPALHSFWEGACCTWAGRECAWDQAILNAYPPQGGLAQHVDLPAYADGIASVSLAAHSVLTFTHVSALAGAEQRSVARASGLPLPALRSLAEGGCALHPVSREHTEGTAHCVPPVWQLPASATLDDGPLPPGALHPAQEACSWPALPPAATACPTILHVAVAPGDVLFMAGPARHEWSHGIRAASKDTFPVRLPPPGAQKRDATGAAVQLTSHTVTCPRGARLSVTLRALLPAAASGGSAAIVAACGGSHFSAPYVT